MRLRILNSRRAAPSSTTPRMSTTADVARAIDFLTHARALKRVARAGWLQRGLPARSVESVADHSWRVALFALVLAPSSGVDRDRAIRMALVHDLAECVVGDITPNDGVSDEEKRRRERAAMRDFCEGLTRDGDGLAHVARDVEALWEEYELGESAEAKLVKDMDKLEMIMQAHEYEGDGEDAGGAKRGGLEEFFTSTAGKWRTTIGEECAGEIVRRRDAAMDGVDSM